MPPKQPPIPPKKPMTPAEKDAQRAMNAGSKLDYQEMKSPALEKAKAAPMKKACGGKVKAKKK